MDRISITQMANSLRVFSRKRSLLKMTKEELANMPKEVMIACAPEEIALVWEKLPTHLHDDIDILKYQYCTEHHGSSDSSPDVDVNDGPPPRRMICCFCNMKQVEIASNNSMHVNPSMEPAEEVFDNCCCSHQ